MSSFASFIRRSLTLVFALVAWIGGGISGEPYIVSGDMQATRSLSYSYGEGVTFCQGLATDGAYFYGTGAIKPIQYNTLVKIDAASGEIVQRHEMCIPRALRRKGFSHLGDCCLYDGRLYVALEDDGFSCPAVIEYDPQTLEYLDYHELPKDNIGTGNIPWCEVKDGILYYSQSNRVGEIRMLNVTDYSYLGALTIDRELFKVQGGEVYDGMLYMVTNEGFRKKTMYAVDLETGHVETVFVRCTGKLDAEGEGIAVFPMEDGSLFHITDVGPVVRITSFKPM